LQQLQYKKTERRIADQVVAMEVKDLKVLQHIHTLKILLGCEEHLTEKFSKSNSLVQLCSLCHKSTLNKISSSKKQNLTEG
jgi:hypothetical protein